jgi:hypothetical protein
MATSSTRSSTTSASTQAACHRRRRADSRRPARRPPRRQSHRSGRRRHPPPPAHLCPPHWPTTRPTPTDAIGNLTSKAGISRTYGSIDSGPHQARNVGGQTYSYDANGNLMSGGNRTYTWTAENLPASVAISPPTPPHRHTARCRSRRLPHPMPGRARRSQPHAW